MKNCPNCGSPIQPYKCRCDYCGTYYFDFTAFDMTGDSPYYVKFKTPMGIITALARPEMKAIEVNRDSVDCVDPLGRKIGSITRSQSCDLEVTFHTQAQVDSEQKALFILEVQEE